MSAQTKEKSKENWGESNEEDQNVKDTDLVSAEETEKHHNDSDLEKLVKDVLQAMKGFTAKYNKDQALAVVDLAAMGVHQGTQFRQLFIKEQQGFMEISLRETFKSSYGGQSQRKTLNKFVVPVSETKSYELLQARFFGYNRRKNLEEGKLFMDSLTQTTSN